MSSMNHVILLGGLTREPELRHTNQGQAICKFSLAVTETYKDKAGKATESTCYVDVDAWGRLGEVVAQYLRKGSQALVQGKLQMEQWTAKDGSKRSKLSLRAIDVQFVGGKPLEKKAVEEFEEPDDDIPSPIEPSTPTRKPNPPIEDPNEEPPF